MKILNIYLSLFISIITNRINVLIKMIFTKFSDCEKPWTYTETFLSISTKLSLFSFINSAIVPYV